MLIWVLAALAWFIGGLLGAEVLGKLWPGASVRGAGSGNPGASNALRVRGKGFALLVLLWDMAKPAWLLLLPLLWPLLPPEWITVTPESAIAILGLVTVAGHIWPPLFGFKGGKGVATACGVLAVLLPAVLPWVLGAWLLVFCVFGYSGLASVIAALVLPMWAISVGDVDDGKALMAFCMMLAALILGAHRINLQRLLRGEESRFNLPWLPKGDQSNGG